MITLKNIFSGVQTEVDGQWVPARPLNWQKGYASLRKRIYDAWQVFMCRAEAFEWPEDEYKRKHK